MRTVTIDITFGGPDLMAILEAAYAAGLVHDIAPARAADPNERQIQYSTGLDMVLVRRDERPNRRIVHVRRTNVAIDVETLTKRIADIPFEIASIGRRHVDWGNPAVDDEAYSAPGWGDNHRPMDWAAAFKGAGHARLVSRNWLENGPWRQLVRADNDTSIAVFYDLEAPPEQALEQARPGHRQLGIGDESGFLQIPFNYTLDLKGLYDANARELKVVVLGRELAPLELLEWAAIRANQKLGAGQPIDTVRFVFPDEAEARANRARLWRYGHQCWAIIDGDETRLD